MRAWVKALLAVDRRLGTGEPPTRVEVAVARHSVRSGVVFGSVLGLGFVWALSGFGDPGVWVQAVLLGAVMGFFVWGACRLARWQHEYDARTGRLEEARQAAVRGSAEPISPTRAVLLSLGVWVISSGVYWVIGPLINIPRSLPWCASLGAVLTTSVIISAWLKRRRFR